MSDMRKLLKIDLILTFYILIKDVEIRENQCILFFRTEDSDIISFYMLRCIISTILN